MNIVNEILHNNPRPMIQWNERRKNGDFYRLVANIKRLLDLISGGMRLNMLADVLNRNEKFQLAHTYKKALEGYAKISSNAKQRKRHRYVFPLRNAGLTYREAHRLGFKVSPHLWKSCENQEDRKNVGQKPISLDLKQAINDYAESISNVASNRFLKKLNNNALYRTMTLSQAYDEFPFKCQLGFSTFCKYIDDRYKKPHRLTDLCDYCELYKKLQIDILKSINEISVESLEIPDPNFGTTEINIALIKEQFKSDIYSNNERVNLLLDDLNTFEEIEYHRSIAKRQRNIYNQMRNNKELLNDSLLIEIDFKQKIVIGSGPRDMNGSYYKRIQRSYLSFGVYCLENDEISCNNFDIVNSGTSQTASTVIRAFTFIRSTEAFKILDKKKYVIWLDCGNHFRCAEMLYFLFEDLYNEGIEVKLNYFAEKHGKNQRDQHFSTIAFFIEIGSLEKRLTSSADIIEVIKHHNEISNIRRIRLNQKPINLFIYELASDYAYSKDHFYRKPTSLRSLYNFQMVKESELDRDCCDTYSDESDDDDLKNKANIVNISKNSVLVTTVFSDLTEKIKISYEDYKSTFADKDNINEIDEFNESNEILKKVKEGFKKKRMKICSYFGIVNALQEANDPNNVISQPLVLLPPEFCQYVKDKRNFDCYQCKSAVLYEPSMINILSQPQINEELSAHNHPKSMKIGRGRNVHQRRIEEARRELLQHYKYAHKWDIDSSAH